MSFFYSHSEAVSLGQEQKDRALKIAEEWKKCGKLVVVKETTTTITVNSNNDINTSERNIA